MSKNEIVINPPEGLTEELIQNSLRKALHDKDLNITNFSVKPAIARGENYLSQIFRINAEIISSLRSQTSFSLLVKSLPKGREMEDYIEEFQLFEREAKMLSEILPKIHLHLNQAGYPHKLAAEIYYTQGRPNDLIILEDLRPLGYKVADRKTGLDLDHSIIVLESLAVLHAGSLAVIQEEAEDVKSLGAGFWLEHNRKMLIKLLEKGVVILADEVEKWNDTPKKYVDLLRSLENSILDKLFNAFGRRDDRLNVVIHGDPWTSNIMFQYENEKVKNLKFVDFQIGGFNAPVLDVIYFIFTSTIGSIKLSKLDYFLEVYYAKLKETCGSLKISEFTYSFKDFKDDFESRLFFALAVSICAFPFTICQDDNVMDFNEMLDDSERDGRMYKTERYVREMKMLLPFFEEKGLFNEFKLFK